MMIGGNVLLVVVRRCVVCFFFGVCVDIGDRLIVGLV